MGIKTMPWQVKPMKNIVPSTGPNPVRIEKIEATYYYLGEVLHREDGKPAIEWRNGDRSWYKHGKLHRENGPAHLSDLVSSWYKEGKLHREDGPAIRHNNGSEEYYLNDQYYSKVDFYKKIEEMKSVSEVKNGKYLQEDGIRYYKDGIIHRDDGPAAELFNGFKYWYKHGQLHRIDGPAVEEFNGVKKHWYKNGKRHREDGPASEVGAYKTWFLDDKPYTEHEFNRRMKELKSENLEVVSEIRNMITSVKKEVAIPKESEYDVIIKALLYSGLFIIVALVLSFLIVFMEKPSMFGNSGVDPAAWGIGELGKYANKETLTVIGALLALYVIYKGAMKVLSLVKMITLGFPKTLVVLAGTFVGGAALTGYGIDRMESVATTDFTNNQLLETSLKANKENAQLVFNLAEKRAANSVIQSSEPKPYTPSYSYAILFSGIASMFISIVGGICYLPSPEPTKKK